MVAASDDAVLVRDAEGDERPVRFDYLVLAVGSTYSDPIKPAQAERTLAEREASWRDASAKLATASSVLIVGAGAVGVELAGARSDASWPHRATREASRGVLGRTLRRARRLTACLSRRARKGEILTVYPKKHVTFVDLANTILPGFDEVAAAYSRSWLEWRGAELMLAESIEQISAAGVLLKSGVQVKADVVYKCVGVMPNTAMLKDSPYAASFGFRNSIEVNDHLQVVGQPRAYCVGDMMWHSSRELKLGHTAEVNGHLAARNILRDVYGKPLLSYPRGVTGADTTPKIYCLSLGRYDAVMGFNGLVLRGWYVAVLKWLLEWTKVAAAGERPVGVLFWHVADATSNIISRTLLASSTLSNDEIDLSKGMRKAGAVLSFPHPMLNFLRDPVFADVGMLIMRVVT
eukprot:4030759-Prymnesium_polylepis.1